MTQSKRCVRCGESKPPSDFHRDAVAADGYRSTCRACAVRAAQSWDQAHPEATLARKRESGRRRRAARPRVPRLAWPRLVYPEPIRLAWPTLRYPAVSEAEKRTRLRAATRRWYARNREAQKEWRRQNRERELARQREWYERNKAHVFDKTMARKARKLAVLVAPVDRMAILERDKGMCGLCGLPVDPGDWHLDHVIPLAAGGTHEPANVQVAHPFCNLSKGSKTSS